MRATVVVSIFVRVAVVSGAALAVGCAEPVVLVRPVVAALEPSGADVVVTEGDTVQPPGFRPIAILRAEGVDGGRDALMREIIGAARSAGCTYLFVTKPYHYGFVSRATAVCGVVEPAATLGVTDAR